MKRTLSLAVLLALGLLMAGSVAARADDPKAKLDYFQEKVRPLLQKCVVCHSGDTPGGDLRLTTRDLALQGGEHGAALQPSDPAKSLLVTMTAAKKMPPKNPLSDEQAGVLRKWVGDGAVWEGTLRKGGDKPRAGADWWALQPVRRPELPTVKRKEWVRNPIDAFVLAALEKEGLQPTATAERKTLLRRVTLDLHGLPPTPAEIDAFVKDQAPDAYEKVIGRLLASPRYGERWGRHWLDVVRFGESNGFERDALRDNAYPYRDYVIRAFNDDKPYPQFVKEQLAGDVLAPASADGVIATGFLVCGPYDDVGNTAPSPGVRARAREDEMEEMIAAVGQTFLGLTVNCAHCHDHKFDPITQKDYYRLKAVFEGVRFGQRAALLPDQVKEREASAAKLNQRVAELDKAIGELEHAGFALAQKEARRPAVEKVPTPVARWNFEAGTKDLIGSMHGTLQGGAVVENGRLKLNGTTAVLQTAPLSKEIKAKTLEAWVSLANLSQRGGGVLSLETKDGNAFDAIVFGEREPKKWIAGSDGFQRTRDLAAAEETAAPGELVHLAIVYAADGKIGVYRNGVPYAEAYQPGGGNGTLRTYPAGEGRVLLGQRHEGGGNAFFAGEIAEARLYDKALSAEEVAGSFKTGPIKVSLDQALKFLSADQRRERDRLLAERNDQRELVRKLPPLAMAWAAVSAPAPPTHLLTRGDLDKQAEQVSAAAPSAVKTPSPELGLNFDTPEGTRRLKFAEWLTSPEHPLTARVLVNRVWHYHFGRGLVASPSDFGYNGERPAHPELLDWLATEFVARGWSMKKLHKLILLSATYQQSATFDPQAAAKDADDRLLWRFDPQRLEGEAVRDAMLFVSGELNEKMYGPSFRPFTVRVFNSTFYTLIDPGTPEFNRRSVYRVSVNSAKDPVLEAFDCPDPSTKTPRRSITTTPLQALGLMNNSFVLRQAHKFGERVAREAGTDAGTQVTLAYRLALGREPNANERERAAALVKINGVESLCWVLFNASEFLYVR